MVSGHNYILTILVGASNCPVEQAYDKDACQIVNPDASLRCDIVVFKPLSSNGDDLQLTKHVCDKGIKSQSLPKYFLQIILQLLIFKTSLTGVLLMEPLKLKQHIQLQST